MIQLEDNNPFMEPDDALWSGFTVRALLSSFGPWRTNHGFQVTHTLLDLACVQYIIQSC